MGETEQGESCMTCGPGHSTADCPKKKGGTPEPAKPVDDGANKEITSKSRYFIQEPTLELTLQRLREVEESKRKIIIYVGVHPNEKTDELVKKYADKWAKDYDATIVCHPTEDTPHAIWKKHGLAYNNNPLIRLPENIFLDEPGTAKELELGSDDAFIIHFHGTPVRKKNERQEPGLEFVTSRYAKHPEEFNDRPRAALYNYPNITNGLEDVITHSNNEHIGNYVHEDREGNYEDTPNRLLVEYHYHGNDTLVTDPYFVQLLANMAEAEKVGSVFPLADKEGVWQRQLKMGPEYIDQPTLSEDAVKQFDKVFVLEFEKMLAHIFSRLPT